VASTAENTPPSETPVYNSLGYKCMDPVVSGRVMGLNPVLRSALFPEKELPGFNPGAGRWNGK